MPYRTRAPRTTTQKGLGHRHQQNRARLITRHIDGTPCWWCGKRMFRDKARNRDGRALHADHDTPRSRGGSNRNPPTPRIVQ